MPDSQSHYLKLCERTLSFAVSPVREEGEVAQLESPNGLGATAVSAYAEKCQELNLLDDANEIVREREQSRVEKSFSRTVAGGVGVIIDSGGQLGTVTCSARFNEAIKPMDKASEAILALKPVTFRYKQDLDPKGIPQFGLVAEQVAKVNSDLVARDEEGKPYSVRYEAMNAMLLNEFLKEHRRVVSLQAAQAEEKRSFESALAQQLKQIQALMTTVKEQAAQLQKVSNQLELIKPALRVVANDQ